MARPNFFIVGCPKCGTTSMHDYLGQHPEIFMSKLKEPGYFNPDLKIHRVWEAQSEENYLTLFKDAGGAKRIGESSTWYMMSEEAAQRINAWDGNAKVVVMLRSPAEAVYSLHGQLLWSCNEHILDFEEAMEAEEGRRRGEKIAPECVSPDALQYTRVFTYAPQLKRYFDAMGRERVKVILFEEFVKETPRVYRETLEFLEVEPGFKAEFTVANAVKPVAPGFLKFFARRPRLRAAVHALVPADVQRRLIDLMPFYTRTVKRAPKLDAEMKKRLAPRFREDVEQLSDLLGRDLRHWCKV